MTGAGQQSRPAPGGASLLRVLRSRRTAAMLALGFCSGLPLMLIFDTLSAWLRESGVPLQVIALFSLVTLMYAFKFMWAPLVDRTAVPLLTRSFGHRRSWMLACQAGIVLGLLLIATCDPSQGLTAIASFALLVALFSATQDIVIDAWRIEVAEREEQGIMSAAYQWGYYAAAMLGASLPFVIASRASWQAAYATMAAVMALGAVAVVAAPQEKAHKLRAIETGGLPSALLLESLEWVMRLCVLAVGALLVGVALGGAAALPSLLNLFGATGAAAAFEPGGRFVNAIPMLQLASALLGFGLVFLAARPLQRRRTRPGVYLAAAFHEPVRDFFSRYHGLAALILALICAYRLSQLVVSITNPFYLDLGFTLTDIAKVRSLFAIGASMTGLLLGGIAIKRLGLMPALVIGAFAGPVSNLAMLGLTLHGPDIRALFLVVGLNNLSGGFAGTCLIAYMSSLTSLGFTATQFALFSSLFALPGRLLASQSGRIVETAANAAEPGRPLSGLSRAFAEMPAASFYEALTRSGVRPSSLATGYAVFFAYAAGLGVLAVALASVVAARERRRTAQQPAGAATG